MRHLLLLVPLAAFAQDLEKGALVFRQTCAQGYCHGSGGTQGRAPKLIGRAYDGAAALKIIRDGVANTGMPGFARQLDAAQMDAVVAYVVKVSGGDMASLKASGKGAASDVMPTDARQGRTLFFDALRGVNRCSTCHALDGKGTAVGPNLAAASSLDVSLIREGKPASVRMATLLSGESMPALVVEQTPEWTRAYDLGAVPPVLRTFRKGEATFSGGSAWRHSNAIRNYTDADLAAVAAYLRRAAQQ